MSFIILLLIIFLIYACLAKYGTMLKVAMMISLIFGMTAAFLIYGIFMFRVTDVFSIAGTDINLVSFIHVCVVWAGADIICAFKIKRNYRYYLEVNSETAISAGQAQV
jgi:hypothetical protein